MIITVAGEKKEFPEGLTISGLIEAEKVEMPEYVTVSVNEEFLQKENFYAHKLHDGDSVEFLLLHGRRGGVEVICHSPMNSLNVTRGT